MPVVFLMICFFNIEREGYFDPDIFYLHTKEEPPMKEFVCYVVKFSAAAYLGLAAVLLSAAVILVLKPRLLFSVLRCGLALILGISGIKILIDMSGMLRRR